MLLFLGLPLFFKGLSDFTAHAARGRLDALTPAFIAVFASIFVFFGLSIVARVASQIMIQKRGRLVDATVVEVTREPGGPCTFHYSYSDTMGQSRQGKFWSDREYWQFGDKGKAAVDPLAPDKSVWVTEKPPREPLPVVAIPMPGSLGIKRWLTTLGVALSLAAGATGVYFFWEKIWIQHGFIGGFNELGALAVLGLFFTFTLLALVPLLMVGSLVGFFGVILYTFVRFLMHD
jgi:hypothetical protein